MYIARILIFALTASIVPAHAEKVISIADGDTLTVLHDNKPLRIRLADIDAPEKAQAFGERSKQSLSDMCFGKEATYQVQDIDKYGRTVARVTCAGIDVNKAQVEKGLAWVYSEYSTDIKLPGIQATAKVNATGLWADKAPIPPWTFRHAKQSGVSQPDQASQSDTAKAATECHTGPRGGHYKLVHGKKRYGC